jgi:hypothetical protein
MDSAKANAGKPPHEVFVGSASGSDRRVDGTAVFDGERMTDVQAVTPYFHLGARRAGAKYKRSALLPERQKGRLGGLK